MYLATMPGDVFSDKGLIYKPEAKGYLLIGAGANGMDDDGRWYDDEPRGDDPRVRMPLPAQEGLIDAMQNASRKRKRWSRHPSLIYGFRLVFALRHYHPRPLVVVFTRVSLSLVVM